MPNNFVVFCEARTGSYSLASRLNSLDDVICHGEVFKKEYIEISNFHKNKLQMQMVAERNRDPVGFILSLRDVNPKKHFGFKLFNHHINWAPKLVDYLSNHETKKVILYRDPIEVYSSTLRTQRTGVWTLKEGGDSAVTEAAPQVTYTEDSFFNFFQHYNRFLVAARLIQKMPNSFVLWYHQINDIAAIAAVLNFIGSKESASRSFTEYKRQYSGDLKDSFANWEELAARMKDDPFVSPPLSTYQS